MGANNVMLPKPLNNFTLTPDNESSQFSRHNKYNMGLSDFDAKILGQLGTFLRGIISKYYSADFM